MQQFIPLPLLDDKGQPVSGPELAWRHRLNGFGSSYYFTRTILKRRRLTPSLHLPICLSLEKDHLKDVKEYPRDHFKSTIACEGMPIWRVLPFGDRDEEMFRKYHTSGVFTHTALDEFCRWQRKIHNPHLRNLLISETDKNARKLGTRIRRHFESNAIFRTFYPEIIPTSAERWTDCSLQIHVPGGTAPHGEGTFDFVGVGGALQSNHYNGLLIQDDLVGRKAIESASVMDKTIEYHQLLVGVFDDDDRDHESDELVIGNRWGFADVNSYIREHEPWFHIESHSAMGGCCGLHPAGQPIFPEEFSEGKLMKLKMRLGTYNFSCFPVGTPVLLSDFSEKDISKLCVGDKIIGYNTENTDSSKHGYLQEATIEFVNVRQANVFEYTTKSGRKIQCTADHKWLKGPKMHRKRDGFYGTLCSVIKIMQNEFYVKDPITVCSVYTPTGKITERQQRDFDWLGGILDGEGTVNPECGTVLISQSQTINPEVWEEIRNVLVRLNIPFVFRDDCSQFFLQGGRSLKIRLLKHAKMAKAARFFKHWQKHPGRITENNGYDEVVSVKDLGMMDVYNIQSSTGNYVAWGYATKNCQFMNSPVSPEDADFKEDWLGHYQVVYPGAATKALDGIIQHTVKDGVIRKDIPINQLKLAIATDPTHSQNAGNGRCRHSIVVVGMSDVGNYYLLDCWAESCSFEKYFSKVFEMSKRWGLHRVGFETCAGQGLGAYHIQYYAGIQGYRLSIVELKGEVELADGTMSHKKEFRIRDVLSPLCEFGRFFTPVGRDGKDRFQDFLSEYCRFPKGTTIDILDALAYIPQMLRNPINSATAKQMRQLNKQMANLIGQPYSVGVRKSLSSRIM